MLKKLLLVLMIASLGLVPGCGRKDVIEMQKEIETLKMQISKFQEENESLKKQVELLNGMVKGMSELNDIIQREKEKGGKAPPEAVKQEKK